MLKRIQGCRATWALMAVWAVLFVLDRRFGLMPYLAGQGIGMIGHAYYRFFTGPLLHFNLGHLLANLIGIYWVGCFAERSLGSVRFFAFGAVAGTLAEGLFACLVPAAGASAGGSIWVFSYLGLIIALQLFKPAFPRFQARTQYGEWILGYSLLGNLPFLSLIPVFSFVSIETVVTHLCALAVGFALGALGIVLKAL